MTKNLKSFTPCDRRIHSFHPEYIVPVIELRSSTPQLFDGTQGAEGSNVLLNGARLYARPLELELDRWRPRSCPKDADANQEQNNANNENCGDTYPVLDGVPAPVKVKRTTPTMPKLKFARI